MRGWAGTGEESADEVRVGMNARWRFASSSGTSGGTRAPGTEADAARLTEQSCLMLAALALPFLFLGISELGEWEPTATARLDEGGPVSTCLSSACSGQDVEA